MKTFLHWSFVAGRVSGVSPKNPSGSNFLHGSKSHYSCPHTHGGIADIIFSDNGHSKYSHILCNNLSARRWICSEMLNEKSKRRGGSVFRYWKKNWGNVNITNFNMSKVKVGLYCLLLSFNDYWLVKKKEEKHLHIIQGLYIFGLWRNWT